MSFWHLLQEGWVQLQVHYEVHTYSSSKWWTATSAIQNIQRNVGFEGARLLTHGIMDLFSGRSSRTGGSAVWEGSSGCIVCDTDSRTPDKTQGEFSLHKSRKTADFWEEHALSVCFTFWQTLLHSNNNSKVKITASLIKWVLQNYHCHIRQRNTVQ